MAQVITQVWDLVANIVTTMHSVVTRRHIIITRRIRISSITINRRQRWHGQIRKVEHVRVCIKKIRRTS